jgi:hypothetical protein
LVLGDEENLAVTKVAQLLGRFAATNPALMAAEASK